MNKKEYMKNRAALMAKAKNFLEAGDMENFNITKAEVEALDAKFEEASTAQASLDALNNVQLPGMAAANAGVLEGAAVDFAQGAVNVDPHDTPEYRNAFMNYACRGVAMPLEMMNADAKTTTSDVSATIPTTLMRELVRELKSYGGVWAKVRKLNVQGGVQFPILSLRPSATWIGETASNSKSDAKKVQANTSVSFSYFGLECKISQSLLSNIVEYDEFSATFAELAVEAIVQATEVGMFNADGSGKMTGILHDNRVPTANVVTLAPEEFKSWEAWHKKVKAKIKKAYRGGEFFMAQGTFDGYIDGMVDKNGQPVGRVNYGIDGEEAYRFMGKTVETVEDDVLPSYDDAETNDVVAVFFNPKDYGVNTNMQLQVVKWVDNDTNEVKTKAIIILDGKLIDANGVILVKKGAAAAG